MVALNYARDVRIGDKPARAVALGGSFVWPTLPERLFLRGQSMVYDFVGQKYAARLPDDTIDYTTNVNDLGILTRASEATYWGPSGTLLEAAVDEARIQHDPVTGDPLGALIEPSATNLIPGSEDFENWAWANRDIAPGISVEEIVSPRGDVRPIYKVIPPDGVFDFIGVAAASPDGETQGISFFVKPVGDGSRLRVNLFTTPILTLDFDSGDAITSANGQDPEVTMLQDGWLHVKVTALVTHSALRFYPMDANGARGIYLWGVQFENGSHPTSYIPTIDSPVTRAADEVSIDLSDVFNPDEGTLRITAQVREGGVVASLGNRRIISDSSEFKEYDLSYILHSGNTVVQLGEGIFNKVEYFPAMQGEVDLEILIRGLFGNGEQGAIYIPEPKVHGQQVLYQDAAGSEPVVSDGDPVGLMLDRSRGLELGPELVTNGTFDANVSDWLTVGTSTITWEAGAGRIARNNSTGGAYQLYTGLTIGSVLSVVVDVLETSNTPTIQFKQGGGDPNLSISGTFYQFSGTGQKTAFIPVESETVSVGFVGSGAGGGLATVLIDNISVRELPGAHARQATSAARPIHSSSAPLQVYDNVDDAMNVTLPAIAAATVAIATPTGADIQYPVDLSSGSYTITESHSGIIIREGELTAEEQQQVTDYLNAQAGV